MEFQKDLTLEKLNELDFVSFYQLHMVYDKKTGFYSSARLELWDCNRNYCGFTKVYDNYKVQKFLAKSLLQEL